MAQTSPATIAEWDKCLDEGMGYQHIAEMYGVSKHTVRKYLPGRGWTPEQARAHGTLLKHHNEKMRKLERKNKVAQPHDAYGHSDMDLWQRRVAGASKHSHIA